MLEKLVEISRAFRVMNTDVEVILCIDPGLKIPGERALGKTQLLFQKAEQTLSRFNPKSELTHLNASAGIPFEASPLLFEVVEGAIEAARTTGGVFDPTILSALRASGYDRSFEKLIEHAGASPSKLAGIRCRWQDIIIDAVSSSIYLPPDCSIDLGGIGKGWMVDKACRDLDIFDNFAVDAGGDIRVKGSKADGLPWSIGIADPFYTSRELMAVELNRGAICTSTICRRKWELDGKPLHHLIDPRSGEPAQSGVVSATVIAWSAVQAEIIAKAALILGPETGIRFIESQSGASGLLILGDKQILYSAGFKELAYVE